MKPFRICLSLFRDPPFFGINLELLPQKQDWSAKEIINEIERDLATKEQDAETLPGQRNQIDGVFAIGSEHFADLFCVGAVRQRKHLPQRAGEGWALE